MSDSSSFTTTMAALAEMEDAQRARFAPKVPEPPKTEVEAYARDLAAAQSRWIDGPGWFR
jgi:hypothetical protein